jgi:uncharacterized lipoprotein YddW (UPF0748 family)
MNKTFRVAVFMNINDRGRECWDAYTLWYSEAWPSYVETFKIEAKDGREAKRIAIAEAKRRGMKSRAMTEKETAV